MVKTGVLKFLIRGALLKYLYLMPWVRSVVANVVVPSINQSAIDAFLQGMIYSALL